MYILVANLLFHFERDGVLPSNLINIEKNNIFEYIKIMDIKKNYMVVEYEEKKITWSFSLSIKTMSLRDTNIIALDLTEHRA